MTVKMEFTFSNGTKKSVGKSYIYMPGLPISVAIAALPYTTPVMDKNRSFRVKQSRALSDEFIPEMPFKIYLNLQL